MLICILTKNVITSCSVTMMLFLHLEVKPLMTLTTVLYLSCALISGHLAMMLIELTTRRSASFLVVFNRPIIILCRVSLFLRMALCLLLRLFVFRLLRLKRFSTLTLYFFFNDPASTEIYTLSLHDALPIFSRDCNDSLRILVAQKREGFDEVGKSFRSEEHTSELQSHSDLVCRLLLEK